MTNMSCFVVGERVDVVIVAGHLNSSFIAGFIVICLMIKG